MVLGMHLRRLAIATLATLAALSFGLAACGDDDRPAPPQTPAQKQAAETAAERMVG